MSEAKFTPGPWNGKTVIARGLNFIAHAHYGTDEGEANANLIAAAPDLYEALEAAANSSGFQYMFSETRDKINAALAKARGETPE